MRTSNDILLSRIVFGSILVRIKNKDYTYRKASKEINYKADLLYEETIQDHIYDGWLTLDKTSIVLMENGLWGNIQENTLQQLEKQLEDYKVVLFENFMFTKKKQEAKKKIYNIRQQINKLSMTKHSLDQHTLESYASRIRNEYLIMNCLYNSINTRKVFTKQKKTESDFLNDCANEIAKVMPNVDALKNLAKSETWKSYWSASGKVNVFGYDCSDYTDEQRVLINLSKMYDSVYEHPECPSDDIINDDDALDGWMIFQKRKREKEKKKQILSSKTSKANSAGEVFFMASDEQEASEIFDLNDDPLRKTIQQRQNVALSSEQPVDEFNLPDVQAEIQMRMNRAPQRK